MSNNTSLISKKFHNKTPFLGLLNFILCRRGELYTTDLQRFIFMFVMICHGLKWQYFFAFYSLFIVC